MIEIAKIPSQKFSLKELSEAVENALREGNLLKVQQDSRVCAAPDARTIRYYKSLHLLDRPKIIGRQAFYGERHLLQLLAIKALQSISLPLSEIQARLYGRSNQELLSILAAISRERSKASKEVHLVRWSEVDIETGLKLLVAENWNLKGIKMSTLTEKIQIAIKVLEKQTL